MSHPKNGEKVLVTRQEILEHAEADGRVLDADVRYEKEQARWHGRLIHALRPYEDRSTSVGEAVERAARDQALSGTAGASTSSLASSWRPRRRGMGRRLSEPQSIRTSLSTRSTADRPYFSLWRRHRGVAWEVDDVAITRLWRRSPMLAAITGVLVLATVILAIWAATSPSPPPWGLTMLDGAAAGAVIGIMLAAALLTREP